MIEEHDLNESGKRGQKVKGEKIVDDTTRKDRRDGRWYRVQIIKAIDGAYVIGTARATKIRGEHDHYWIDETVNKREIIKILESHIPEADSGDRDSIELRQDYIALIDRVEGVLQQERAKPVT